MQSMKAVAKTKAKEAAATAIAKKGKKKKESLVSPTPAVGHARVKRVLEETAARAEEARARAEADRAADPLNTDVQLPTEDNPTAAFYYKTAEELEAGGVDFPDLMRTMLADPATQHMGGIIVEELAGAEARAEAKLQPRIEELQARNQAHEVLETAMVTAITKAGTTDWDSYEPDVQAAMVSSNARRWRLDPGLVVELLQQRQRSPDSFPVRSNHNPDLEGAGQGSVHGFSLKARPLDPFSGPVGKTRAERLVSIITYIRGARAKVRNSNLHDMSERQQVEFVGQHFTGEAATWWQAAADPALPTDAVESFSAMMAGMVVFWVGEDAFMLLHNEMTSLTLRQLQDYPAYRSKFGQLEYAMRCVAKGDAYSPNVLANMFVAGLMGTRYYEDVAVDRETGSAPNTLLRAYALADARHKTLVGMNQACIKRIFSAADGRADPKGPAADVAADKARKAFKKNQKERKALKAQGGVDKKNHGKGGASPNTPARPRWLQDLSKEDKEALFQAGRCYKCKQPLKGAGHSATRAADCTAPVAPMPTNL